MRKVKKAASALGGLGKPGNALRPSGRYVRFPPDRCIIPEIAACSHQRPKEKGPGADGGPRAGAYSVPVSAQGLWCRSPSQVFGGPPSGRRTPDLATCSRFGEVACFACPISIRRVAQKKRPQRTGRGPCLALRRSDFQSCGRNRCPSSSLDLSGLFCSREWPTFHAAQGHQFTDRKSDLSVDDG
jgi:hypothetical protein